MEKTTTQEAPIVTDKAQNRIEHVRKYNRDYYHAHKKPVECCDCKLTFSSVSALRRHQKRNLKCRLIQAKNTIDQLKDKDPA